MTARSEAEIWKLAFDRLKTWTQAVKALPGDEVIFERAKVEVLAVTRDLSTDRMVVNSIAASITRYFRRKWNPAYRRKPPVTTRAWRSDRNGRILASYFDSVATGNPKTTRTLGTEFDLKASQISRILRSAGVVRGRGVDPAIGDVEVETLLNVLGALLPADGVRVVYSSFLQDQLALNREEVSPADFPLGILLGKVVLARLSWHFHEAEDRVVVCRGRTLTPAKAAFYLRTRDPRLDEPKREIIFSGKRVWTDMAAALAVMEQRAKIDDWRIFLEASIQTKASTEVLIELLSATGRLLPPDRLAEVKELACDDPRILLTRVRKGLRNWTDRGYTASIAAWNQPYQPWSSAMASILYLIDAMDGVDECTALKTWLSLTFYRARIEFGLLHFRTATDIDTFLVALKVSDERKIWLRDALLEQE